MLSSKAHSPKKHLCACALAVLGLILCATLDAEDQGAALILSISPADFPPSSPVKHRGNTKPWQLLQKIRFLRAVCTRWGYSSRTIQRAVVIVTPSMSPSERQEQDQWPQISLLTLSAVQPPAPNPPLLNQTGINSLNFPSRHISAAWRLGLSATIEAGKTQREFEAAGDSPAASIQRICLCPPHCQRAPAKQT